MTKGSRTDLWGASFVRAALTRKPTYTASFVLWFNASLTTKKTTTFRQLM